jgi:hypothetical protein
MVQSELSLEGVKVVRNDLSDSDLEIISTSCPPAASGSKPAGLAAGKPVPAAAGRSRGNIFDANKLYSMRP